MTRPALPHDAGSLVLVRRGPNGREVLLGRRAGKHRFLPNVYAFPGGRVDLPDKLEIPFKPLNNIDLLLRPAAVAAVRETWEETGIALGMVEAGRLRPDLSGLHYLCRAITPAESPIRFHARFFLQDVTGMPLTLGGSGELLDLAFRPLDEALRLPLADITEFVLGMVGGLGPDLAPQRAAFWRYRRGKPMIRWDNP
jgi:8-oxo-dGTP pyrophosphatase MutT (NUDIX family)